MKKVKNIKDAEKVKIKNIKSEQKHKTKKKGTGFTLVELIVVITILAILGTIAFVSFQSYTKQARDGTRLSDINNIEKSLGLYITEIGNYPVPDGGVNITYSGGLAWTQGTLGDDMMRNLKDLSKKPVDPLYGNEYTYSVTSLKNEYQVGAIQEVGLVGNFPINSTYAAEPNSLKAIALVKGTYNEVMLKVSTGAVDYILAVPSIINSDIGNVDIVNIINNRLLVFNEHQNIPSSYKGIGFKMNGGFDYVPTVSKIEVFKGNLDELNGDIELKKELLANIKEVYDGSIIAGKGVYADVIKLDTNNLQNVELLANNYLKNNKIVKGDVVSNEIAFVKALSGSVSVIKTDNNGNVYIAGSYYEPTLKIGSITLNKGGSTDGYVAKFDSQGEVIWAKSIGGNATSQITTNEMAIDNAGSIYVSGQFTNNIKDHGGNLIPSTGMSDIFVLKYDSSGNSIWLKSIGGDKSDLIMGLVVDTNSNVYIGGAFESNSISIGSNTYNRKGPILYGRLIKGDGFIAKYDSNGNIGWSKHIGSTGYDRINSLALDSNSNLFVGGSTSSPNLALFSTHTLVGTSDGFIAKYDSNGTILASKKVSSGYSNTSDVKSIGTDTTGNLYVYGVSNDNPNITFKEKGNKSLSSNITKKVSKLFSINNASAWAMAPDNDKYIAKFDNTLNTIYWNKGIHWSLDTNSIKKVVIDNSGNLYLGGTYQGTISLGGITLNLPAGLIANGFVLKYDNSGNQVFLKSLQSEKIASNIQYIGLNKVNAAAGAGEYIYLGALTIDNSGNIFIAGYASEMAKIKIGSQTLSNTNFIAKYNSNLR